MEPPIHPGGESHVTFLNTDWSLTATTTVITLFQFSKKKCKLKVTTEVNKFEKPSDFDTSEFPDSSDTRKNGIENKDERNRRFCEAFFNGSRLLIIHQPENGRRPQRPQNKLTRWRTVMDDLSAAFPFQIDFPSSLMQLIRRENRGYKRGRSASQGLF